MNLNVTILKTIFIPTRFYLQNSADENFNTKYFYLSIFFTDLLKASLKRLQSTRRKFIRGQCEIANVVESTHAFLECQNNTVLSSLKFEHRLKPCLTSYVYF